MSEANIMSNYKDLDKIAFDVYHGEHNHFLKSFARAWLQADPENKSILAPAWNVLIEKYKLG